MNSEIDASNIVVGARRPVQQLAVGDSPPPENLTEAPVSEAPQISTEAPVSTAPLENPFLVVPGVFMDPSNNDEDPDIDPAHEPISPISSNASGQEVGPDISLYQLVGAMERISMIDMARYAQTHPQLFNAMLAAMNLASGHGEAQAAPTIFAPPHPDRGSVVINGAGVAEFTVPINVGDTQYVSVPNIFERLIKEGKQQISSSPLLRNMPFELVEQLAASDEVHRMFISVNDAHGGGSEISPVRILELCYILKSQETTTVVDIMTYDESPIPMNRQLQTQLNLVNKLAPGGENVFDVVHEVLNIATPGVYGIAAPVDFNGLLSLKWLLGIAVNAIGSNDVARMKLMDVYCLVAEVLDRDDQKLSPAERVKISSVEIVGILNNSVACRAAVRLRNELDRHLLQMLLGLSLIHI